jgi:hypothetical protein
MYAPGATAKSALLTTKNPALKAWQEITNYIFQSVY